MKKSASKKPAPPGDRELEPLKEIFSELRAFEEAVDLSALDTMEAVAALLGKPGLSTLTKTTPPGWRALAGAEPDALAQDLKRQGFHANPARISTPENRCLIEFPADPDPVGARERLRKALESGQIVDALAAAYSIGLGDGFLAKARIPRIHGDKNRIITRDALVAYIKKTKALSPEKFKSGLVALGYPRETAEKITKIAKPVARGRPKKT